jgi:hypothetical protein
MANPNPNKNWPRWMKASMYKWFIDVIQKKNNVTCFIETTEHIDKNGNYITKLDRWAEARFNGPITTPVTGSQFHHTVIINFLISTKLDQKNIYEHDATVGLVYEAYVNSIPVFKFGTGPDDDQSLLGCFQLEADNKNAIQVAHFGQLDVDVKLTQSIIEAHYNMWLDL